VPREIVIGETLEWRTRLVDFSPGDGWTLSYAFRGAGPGFDATATADNGEHLTAVASSVTATLSVGTYSWEAWVTNGTEDHMVGRDTVQVIRNLKNLATNATLDNRSEAKKILDAIDAMALGKATLDQQSYQIGTRQLARIPIHDLLALRTHYAQMYAREKKALRRKNGAPYFKNIHVRRERPS
jgi:hypothetical protein